MAPKITTDFWHGRRVVITGHTGFKGSWLSLWLQSLGAKLLGVALPPHTTPALFEIARVADGMNHFIADVRDFNAISSQIRQFDPEIIIHMAAQPIVRVSYQHPIDTFAINVIGTAHVLEAARDCKALKAVVNVTTDKCYQDRDWTWPYREIDSLGGYDPYSSSKACSELVSDSYRESFLRNSGIALATARAGNVIGGGDWASDRLIPDILRAIQNEEPVLIRNPNAIRPWQHVLEPLSGYLLLAERLYTVGQEYAEAWNFGPEDSDARTVEWISESLCKTLGHGAKCIHPSEPQPHESSFLKLDISKAKKRLQWSPKWSLDTALSRIANWHECWLSGGDMREVCLEQISEYGKPQ
jgi:CDP-glucose 4,6-dehydratase